MSPVEHQVVRYPHDLSGEIFIMYNEMRFVTWSLRIDKVLPFVIIAHVVKQIDKGDFVMTS